LEAVPARRRRRRKRARAARLHCSSDRCKTGLLAGAAADLPASPVACLASRAGRRLKQNKKWVVCDAWFACAFVSSCARAAAGVCGDTRTSLIPRTLTPSVWRKSTRKLCLLLSFFQTHPFVWGRWNCLRPSSKTFHPSPFSANTVSSLVAEWSSYSTQQHRDGAWGKKVICDLCHNYSFFPGP
jgi:hypothetical protein